MSSVLLLFVLLMAQSWVAVFLLIIWPTGQWLRVVFVLSPPPTLWGPKVSAQTGRHAFQKINRDDWFTSLLCAFLFPALLEPQAAQCPCCLPGTGSVVCPPHWRREGSPDATGTDWDWLSGVTSPGPGLDRTILGKARVREKVVRCVRLHGGPTLAGHNLRATGGLHCLSLRSKGRECWQGHRQ